MDEVSRLQILALLLSLATMRYHYTPTRTMFYLCNLGKILSLRFLKSKVGDIIFFGRFI